MARLWGVFAGWTLWLYRPNAAASVLVALIPWLVEHWPLRGRRTAVPKAPRFPPVLSVASAGFLLSACMGLWAGYDRTGALAVFNMPVGLQKFWGYTLAFLLCRALAGLSTPRALRWGVACIGLVGMDTALLVLLARAGYALPLPALLRDLHPLLSAEATPTGPNPNTAAGVIAPLLCLMLGLSVDGRRNRARGARLWSVAGGISAVCMVAGLALTLSRGGWLSSALAAGLALLWQGLSARVPEDRRWPKLLLWAARDLATIVMLMLLPWFRAWLLTVPDIAGRGWIFYRAGLLIRDFPFTGIGLGTFALVDSTYAEMIHVPTLGYAHAILLDAAVEQGILGAVALLGLWLTTLWQGLWALGRALKARPTPPGRALLAAGLLALVVMMLHGIVDDAFGTSGWMPLLFAPVGVTLAARRVLTDRPSVAQRRIGTGLIASVLLAGMAAVITLGARLPAAWYANLGAVAQARIELPLYDVRYGSSPSLGQLRRWAPMAIAEENYRYALAYDPQQVTAHTRLAQLALARGNYEDALAHAQSAWDSGCHDRGVTMVYSDALLAHGQIEQAVDLVRGLPRAETRLELQAWAYRDVADPVREGYARAARALLETP